jgi:hypothetical protein
VKATGNNTPVTLLAHVVKLLLPFVAPHSFFFLQAKVRQA